MTNLRSDALKTRRIASAFIDFLNSVEPAPGADHESLEVAKDCLSEFFQLNQLSGSDQPEPNLLVNLFASSETSRKNEGKRCNNGDSSAVPAATSMIADRATMGKLKDGVDMAAEASDTGISRDELFGQFFAALEKNNFFGTTPGGDDEHALLDRVTSLFHDAIKEIQGSGYTCDRRSLAEALKTLGNKAMQSDAYADAIERYTCAIALYANIAVYYCNRAAAYTQIEKYDEAIRDSRRAIEIDPTYSKAYSRLGFAFYSQGNYVAAIKGFKKALELDPNNNAVKENLKAAEQKYMEQRARRIQSLRAQGFRQAIPVGSMSFEGGPVPANLASMFANMPYPERGENSSSIPPVNTSGVPPPESMTYTVEVNPSGITRTFTNSAPNAQQQPNPQNNSTEQNYSTMPSDTSSMNPQEGSRLYRSEGPEGNVSFTLEGDQNPEEVMSALRDILGMDLPVASQVDQPPSGTGDGRSASN